MQVRLLPLYVYLCVLLHGWNGGIQQVLPSGALSQTPMDEHTLVSHVPYLSMVWVPSPIPHPSLNIHTEVLVSRLILKGPQQKIVLSHNS